MSDSLNSLKGEIWGLYKDYCRVIKGDTRSLDHGSYVWTFLNVGEYLFGGSPEKLS